MRKVFLSLACTALVFLLHPIPVNACTTFCIRDGHHLIFGRNFDFVTEPGHVIVNQRNVVKTAMVQAPEKRFQWVAKYGSITFNQAGREFPYGGINEKGLVIEQMWLDDTQYPEIDNRYGLTELQWIQYQLDNAATVEEVLKSDSFLRVSKLSMTTLHFLVCDRDGNMATIEYLKGKMVYHTRASMPIPVLTNDTYQKCSDYVKTFSGFGGSHTIPNTAESLDRFARAASLVKDYKQQEVIDYSFHILKNVSREPETKWSIVYDIKNRTVYYKTYTNQTVRKLRLRDVDFSCASPALYVDMEENMQGGRLAFKHHSYQTNRGLIDNLFNQVPFLQVLPVSVREIYASYPETTTCTK